VRKMDAIIRFRGVWLVLFAAGIVGSFALFHIQGRTILFEVAVLAWVAGLAMFLATESFGPLSKARSAISRWGARLLLGVLVLGALGSMVGQSA
jgi:hypothetical protein